MDGMTNREYLVEHQYRNAGNLEARIRFYERFSVNTRGWLPWVFDRLRLPADAHVLDLGCGTGILWSENRARIPPGWEVVLGDLSPGMIEAARRALGEARFCFQVVDAQEMPFEDHRFDGVIANHMLFHVPDRSRALREVRRILTPGGCLYASTNGRTRGPGLAAWVRKAVNREDPPATGRTDLELFSLETGEAQLRDVFSHVVMHRYDDALEITEIEPLIDYVQSTSAMSLESGRLPQLRRAVAAEIERRGSLRLPKKTGMFEAW